MVGIPFFINLIDFIVVTSIFIYIMVLLVVDYSYAFQARSQKIMVGGSFEGNVDLFLLSHSANHSPGAVDELIFYVYASPHS